MKSCPKCVEAISEPFAGWYCREHYLKKEAGYGWYDLKTNNKGFRRMGLKRIFNYYIYKIFS